MNAETEQLASRDFWCEWGALFAWARRHGSGHGISELFTGMINRTGPHENSSLFCDPASINDLPWGARRDAFLTQRLPQRERNWKADRQPGELITSNPPYMRKPIIDFCRLAGM